MKEEVVGKKTLWKNPILWGAVFIIVIGGGLVVSELFSSFSKSRTSNAMVNNVFGQQAENAGVKTCAPLFSTLGQIMTEGSEFSATTFWDQTKPDGHPISAIVGQLYAARTSRGAGIVYAAPVNGACEGTMVRTIVSPVSCQTVVAEQIPQEAQRQKDMGGAAIFRLPRGVNIMVMPASETSCVVMTAVNLADTQ